jgi:hypothetical protein
MAGPVFTAGTTGGIWHMPVNMNMQAMTPQTPLQRRLIIGNDLHGAKTTAATIDAVIPSAKKKEPKVTRRLVQVFIADPDDNVPLDRALLYSGSQKFTDATDQELFFEIDIKTILDAYNAERVKLVNKKVKERTEMLEPVKIRDLRMTVVNIATF